MRERANGTGSWLAPMIRYRFANHHPKPIIDAEMTEINIIL
jgi:hypothetical protein